MIELIPNWTFRTTKSFSAINDSYWFYEPRSWNTYMNLSTSTINELLLIKKKNLLNFILTVIAKDFDDVYQR